MVKSDAVEVSRTPRPSSAAEVGRFPERLESVIGGSIRGFAKRCGISEGTLRGYLAGKQTPTLDRLLAIAEAGGVDFAWLAAGSAEPGPDQIAALLEDFHRFWHAFEFDMKIEHAVVQYVGAYNSGAEDVRRVPTIPQLATSQLFAWLAMEADLRHSGGPGGASPQEEYRVDHIDQDLIVHVAAELHALTRDEDIELSKEVFAMCTRAAARIKAKEPDFQVRDVIRDLL